MLISLCYVSFVLTVVMFNRLRCGGEKSSRQTSTLERRNFVVHLELIIHLENIEYKYYFVHK